MEADSRYTNVFVASEPLSNPLEHGLTPQPHGV